MDILNANLGKDHGSISIALKGRSIALTKEETAEWLRWRETWSVSPSFWYEKLDQHFHPIILEQRY